MSGSQEGKLTLVSGVSGGVSGGQDRNGRPSKDKVDGLTRAGPEGWSQMKGEELRIKALASFLSV